MTSWLPAIVAIVAVAALTLALGCATAPKRLPRDATKVPGEWSVPAEGAPHAPGAVPAGDAVASGEPWWSQLEDPGLARLIEEALAENLELRAAAARLEASLAEARVVGSARKPSVSAGLDAARARRNFIGFPLPGGEEGVLSTTSTVVSADVAVSWEADLWGRLAEARRAEVAEAAAEASELAASRLSLSGEVARAARALAHARARAANQREIVVAWTGTREALGKRFEAGLVPAERVRIAAASLAGSRSDLAAWEELGETAVRRLEVLLGRSPTGTLEVEPTLPVALPAIPVGLPADVIARRHDLVGSERRLDAAAARIAVARRARYPQLALTASGGRESDELAQLLDGDFSVWSIVGGLVAPLFEGGRLRAEIDVAEALGDAAVAEHASAVLRALGEVETALVAERRAAERVGELRHAVEEAAQARREAARRYREGLVELPTLYEGRRLQLEAEGRWIDARRELADARVRLHLALGGSFVIGDEAAWEPATGEGPLADVGEPVAGAVPTRGDQVAGDERADAQEPGGSAS